MLGRQSMPDWVRALLNELTKPPVFLVGEHNTQTGDGLQTVLPPKDGASNIEAATEQTRTNTSSHSTREMEKSANDVQLDRGPDRGRATRPVSASVVRGTSTKGQARAATRSAPHDGVKEKDETVSQNEEQRKWRAAFIQAGVPVSLPSQYGWTVQNVETIDNVLRVQTAKSTFAVKQTHIPVERVRFMRKLCQFVAQNGFTRVPRFALSKKQEPAFIHNGHTFYATRWIHGNPTTFSNVTQVGDIAHALAEFHEASRGFETTDYHPPMEFQLGQMFRKRSEDVRSLLLDAEFKKEQDEFDRIFLELAPVLRSDAEESIRLIEDDRCQSLLNQEEETAGVCHLDVIPGNFIYDVQQQVHLIDLDLATYAPRALDISHLLRRSLQATNFNPEVAYTCFLNYDNVRSIPAEEYLLIEGLLRFPYRVWRLAHTRYRLFPDVAQIEEIRSYRVQEERRQAFLTEFRREIEQQRS